MIRLSRRRSMVLALGLLGLFFTLSILLIRKNQPTPDPSDSRAALNVEKLPFETSPPSNFELQSFHRSETKNGRTLWEVRAERGQYFPESHKAKLFNAELWLYKESGDTSKLLAGEALLNFDGVSLVTAELTAGVNLETNAKLSLTTEQAVINQQTHTVTAPGLVSIQTDGAKITGKSLQANLEKREFTLETEVESSFLPKQRSDKR